MGDADEVGDDIVAPADGDPQLRVHLGARFVAAAQLGAQQLAVARRDIGDERTADEASAVQAEQAGRLHVRLLDLALFAEGEIGDRRAVVQVAVAGVALDQGCLGPEQLAVFDLELDALGLDLVGVGRDLGRIAPGFLAEGRKPLGQILRRKVAEVPAHVTSRRDGPVMRSGASVFAREMTAPRMARSAVL